MSAFRYTAEQRAALRSAVTSSPLWPNYRKAHNLSSAALDIDTLEEVARAFGIDPAMYGTPKSAGRGFGKRMPPAARTVTVQSLRPSFDEIAFLLTDAQRDYAADLFADAKRNGDMLTDKQAGVIRDMIARAHGKAPAPSTSAPAPIVPFDPVPAGDPAAALALLKTLLGGATPVPAALDEGRIIDLIKQHAGTPAHVTIDLRTAAGVAPLGTEVMHNRLPLVVAGVKAGVPLFLSGDAGAGKTTLCKQVAKILERPFYFTGAINSEYKLTGFIDAQGRIVSTAFIKAFKEGGLFLFDEIDGSLPGAVLPFNAAVANRMADLPEGIVEAHPDFVAIAAGNTTGRGPDRLYVGRMQQDAAVLDRYALLNVDIDEGLEAALVGAPRPANAPLPATVTPMTDAEQVQQIARLWVERVRKARSAAQAHKLRHIISPRATLNGAKLLAAGWAWAQVEESCLFKGLDSDSRAKLAA